MSKHTAHFEPLVGCVRVFEPGRKLGDPYVWSCTAVCQGDSVELIGALQAPTHAMRRAVQDLLTGMGFRRLRMTRIKRGRRRSAVLNIVRRNRSAT
jgi:hypothetical protein